MNKYTDITGKRFGKLVAVSFVGQDRHRAARWRCVCDCGGETILCGNQLRKGKGTHCGCDNGNATHRASATKAYRAYWSMLTRCYNKASDGYERYGGRGVQVCQRWRESFEAFVGDMGQPPSAGHSIDRYPNRNGDYEPGNCRWATRSEQQQNKDCNRNITFQGKTLCVMAWAKLLGIKPGTIFARLRRGDSAERALRPINS